jgi:hypothetical protein
VREQNDGVCSRCSMDNNSASRQATKTRIGPWYVFQSRNPAAPGMKFDTLLGFIHKGRVKARSVVRGPTTHQLWRFAAHVKGISREFGICYSCGGGVDRQAGLCPHCNRSQEPPAEPDVFIEGQQFQTPAPLLPETPISKPAPTPLAASDIVVPPLIAPQPSVPRPSDSGEANGRAKSAKASDNPITSEEQAKRAAEGFLSPQDLAAAFNLDFRPKGRKVQKQQTEAARRPASHRKPARWGRRLFALVFLAAIGGAGYLLATKPVIRAQTMDYSKQAVDWSKQKWTEFRLSQAKPARSTAPHIISPADPASVVSDQPAKSEIQSAKSESEPHTNSPAPSKATESPAKPSPWDDLYGKQQAQKTDPPAGSRANEVPPSQPPAVATPRKTGTIDDVRALYREAIDAEGNNDPATAIKKYEQIKEFPSNLWPADLNLRLSQARRQAQ